MSITRKDLNIIINNKIIGLNNNFEYNYQLCALIDQYYNFNDTCYEYNIRLRNSVKNNFYKCFLTDEMKNSFRQWEAKLESMPLSSSRDSIYSQSSLLSLNIIGI